MKTFKLMVKTHTITGLKYLCMTSRTNWREYTGSGVHWKRHLNKHGYHFDTELLLETDSYEDFLEVALAYSELYDVVKSKEFANSIPESGYGDQGKPNILVWWDYATDEQKQEIYERRRDALLNNGNHWALTDKRELVVSKISDAQKLTWDNLTDDEKLARMNNFRSGLREFYEDANRQEVYRNILKSSARNYWDNISDEELCRRGDIVSKARLSMSDEKKRARAIKVGIAFKTSESRQSFVKSMSENRKGAKNPAAKLTTWFGEEYSKKEFNALIKSQKLSKEYIDAMFKSRTDCIPYIEKSEHIIRDLLICPHCGKHSDPTKKKSGFLKWHMTNCKQRKQHNED